MTWPRVQVRHIARLEYGSSLPVGERIEGDIAVFGSNGPVGLHNSYNTGSPVIVVGRKGSHGKLHLSASPVFAIDTTYFIDPAHTQADIRWLYYTLSSLALDRTGQDVGVPGLSREYAYSQRVPLPPHKEQRAIADYLDIETARIDILLSKKRRMIELLQERRRAVITSAFRSNRLQPVEIRPLQAYAEVSLGRQRSPRHHEGPYMTLYLRAANVKDGKLDLSDVKSMNFDPMEQGRFALRKGDILVSEGSGSLSAVGASATWNGEIAGPVCYQNTLLRVRPRTSTDYRFLSWWCRYAYADGLFANVATGANIHHISAERVRSIPMTYLPLNKQRGVADYLDAETNRIDTAIDGVRRVVKLLGERREALIIGAVTGQLAVTHVAS